MAKLTNIKELGYRAYWLDNTYYVFMQTMVG